MNVPYWLLRLLPMWEYICPACRKEVKKNSHRCPHCGERFPLAIRVPPSFLKNPKKLEAYVHKYIFPKVSPFHRAYLTQFFTEIFSDGFESGDFSAWTGTANSSGETCEVESAEPHHGTYNAKFYSDGGWNQYAYCYKDITGQTIIYARTYFKETTAFPNAWGGVHGITAFANQSNGLIARCGVIYEGAVYWCLDYLDAGTFKVAGNGTWWTGGSPSLNTWYCVELYAKIDGSAGEYKVYVDGTERISETGLDTDDRGNVDQIQTGLPQSNANLEHAHRIDCVFAADEYIGPEEEVTLKTVTDSFSLSESVLRNKTLILSDSLGLADSLLRGKSLLLSDFASLSELVTVISGEVMKYVTDSVSSADLVSTPSRVLRALEAIGAADNAVVNKVLQITETVSLAEIVEVGVGGVKKTKLFLILGDLAVQLTGD